MPCHGLEQYLSRLHSNTQADTQVWLDNEGRAQGRYFNSKLTSAFQPIRLLDSDTVIGYEGFARSYSESDQGLCLWKLLDHAANDDESVELDRLCRMLHAINFFRQPESETHDLYLSVHARLLAAVEGNHGTAFNRVLKVLDLPRERIVLQLPAIVEHQSWLLNYVADNYRRNGFRIAVNAADAYDAFSLLDRLRPEVIKLDVRQLPQDIPVVQLLSRCEERGVRVIFKRVETGESREALQRIASRTGLLLHVQGFLWDLPKAVLADAVPRLQAVVRRQQEEASVRNSALG
ncbi:EAL domain-containing protein [Noviherbaspirillum aerium]|uniref:EAL domain-containing protein n=1 Tax=Noviherbaspirillum aerium TaxID=2588497 RepID=UPI00124EC283|nr:EAL domain-containing protein [Noviherbaspirillum aerium]